VSKQAFLDVSSPEGRRRVALGGESLSIGRNPKNTLVIQDQRASRFHCVIDRTDRGFKLRDLDSRNGTELNGERVDSQVLSPGDVIRIGQVEMRFVAAGSDGSQAAPAAVAPPTAKAPTPAAPDDAAQGPSRRGRRRQRPAGEDDMALSDIPAAAAEVGGVQDLEKLVASSPDQSFSEPELSLVTARNQVLHGAAPVEDDDRLSSVGVHVLRLLLLLCIRTRATDVHIEPRGATGRIRARVDGMMIDVVTISQETLGRLMGVVKVLAELDIAQKNVVQEGHFSLEAPQRHVDYRVSFTPAMHGQKLVLRVLDLANAPRYVQDLELPRWMNDQLRKTIRQDSGMVLVCGPTGSGKTTTLYALVRDIDVSRRNVITIEDPVEYQIEGVTQMPINEHQGNTFSTLLRSILRQDPDVILLGEIRDRETAQIAMQAAMTGHLVLSTVHAKDAIGTIFRLLDLGVEPFLVASALNIVLAQRLVRKLCPHCKVGMKPPPQQMMQMGRYADGVAKIFYPRGCTRCLRTGFAGRRAMFEMLSTTEDLRDVILKTPTMQDLRKAVELTMFATLREGGYRMVDEGIT